MLTSQKPSKLSHGEQYSSAMIWQVAIILQGISTLWKVTLPNEPIGPISACIKIMYASRFFMELSGTLIGQISTAINARVCITWWVFGHKLKLIIVCNAQQYTGIQMRCIYGIKNGRFYYLQRVLSHGGIGVENDRRIALAWAWPGERGIIILMPAEKSSCWLEKATPSGIVRNC